MIKDFTKYHREYYRDKRRPKALAFLGDKCVQCGSTEDLQFDHIKPEDKSFNIKDNLTPSNEKVQEELKKCQLLCKACHIEKTAKENSGFSHGTIYGWMKANCSCNECENAKKLWHEKRNKQRRVGNGRGPYQKDPAHRTTKKYSRGCRCAECRAANADKARKLRAKGKL